MRRTLLQKPDPIATAVQRLPIIYLVEKNLTGARFLVTAALRSIPASLVAGLIIGTSKVRTLLDCLKGCIPIAILSAVAMAGGGSSSVGAYLLIAWAAVQIPIAFLGAAIGGYFFYSRFNPSWVSGTFHPLAPFVECDCC